MKIKIYGFLRFLLLKPKEIIPIEFEGLKAMSYGFASKKKAIIRGPMVSSIVT